MEQSTRDGSLRGTAAPAAVAATSGGAEEECMAADSQAEVHPAA